MKTLKNLVILFITVITAVFFAPGVSAQKNNIEPFELNNGGPASRLTTYKMRIDLLEEISQVKDANGETMLIYESWARVKNDPQVKNEQYYKIFTLADTTSVFASMLQSQQTFLEANMDLEVIPLTPLIIDEVLIPKFIKISSTKGGDTKEAIKIFRKEIEAMMRQNYLLVRRFSTVSEEESIQPTAPTINFSENEEGGEGSF